MSEYEGYDALARVYDQLNQEIDYEQWADFLERCFTRFLQKPPELVLDLACGTGRMTRTLANRGYDMIGVDGSASMLSEARMQDADASILYLCQDMRKLELYGTVGATVCCLDSLNYLLSEQDLKKTFSLVHNYSDPGALFLFDVNTPYKFQTVYGNNAYVLENEFKEESDELRAVYCGWQNDYHADTRICDFYLTVFEETADGRYFRSDEHQQERAYSLDRLTALLQECGFELLGVYADYLESEPTDETERWYIAARAVKPFSFPNTITQ